METADGSMTTEKCIGGEKLLRKFVSNQKITEAKLLVMDIAGIKVGEALFEATIDDIEDGLSQMEKDAKEINEEGYVELRGQTPYNSGHIQSSIVVDTYGEESPLFHEVVFSNEIWESNESMPLTKRKMALDSAGNPVLNKKGRPIRFPRGYDWEPLVDEYDYRKNKDVRTPEGSIFNEAYVEEYMDSVMKRKGY
jgi:hypothetical protein